MGSGTPAGANRPCHEVPLKPGSVSPIVGTSGRVGQRSLLVTPGLHRLHHSAVQAETDSNYGNVFSFWDRLFGTYRGKPIQSGNTFRFGLDDVSRERAGNLGSQLELPWR